MPIMETVGPVGERVVPAPVPFEGSQALRKFGALPKPPLEWNPQVERETAHLYERVKAVIPPVE